MAEGKRQISEIKQVECNKNRRSLSKRFAISLAILAVVDLLLISFFSGALVEHYVLHERAAMTRSTLRNASVDGWGSYVASRGKKVGVGDWLSQNIKPDNIRNNLK